MTQENVARVEREREAPITVVIGNPPYNAWQLNENDNNKNRKYEIIDRRVSETYAKDSTASNKNALSDMYVKFFRWAVDRLNGRDGIVCFVSNNSFVEQIAFDGMRKHLLQDFTRVYHVHLEGNVRHNPKLAGTTYNVFGIQVGVGITVAVRRSRHRGHRVLFHRVDKTCDGSETRMAGAARQCCRASSGKGSSPMSGIRGSCRRTAASLRICPDGQQGIEGSAEGTRRRYLRTYSGGVKTNRDEVVYDFQTALIGATRAGRSSRRTTARLIATNAPAERSNLDNFVRYDKIKWSRDAQGTCGAESYAEFRVRRCEPPCTGPSASDTSTSTAS